MADGEFSGPISPCIQAHPRHAGRQGLRFELRSADDGSRHNRLDHRPALRGRLRKARPQQGKRQALYRALLPANTRAGPAEPVLIARPTVYSALVPAKLITLAHLLTSPAMS